MCWPELWRRSWWTRWSRMSFGVVGVGLSDMMELGVRVVFQIWSQRRKYSFDFIILLSDTISFIVWTCFRHFFFLPTLFSFQFLTTLLPLFLYLLLPFASLSLFSCTRYPVWGYTPHPHAWDPNFLQSMLNCLLYSGHFGSCLVIRQELL